MILLDRPEDRRIAGKRFLDRCLQVMQEHERFMHVNQVDRPLVIFVCQVRTHKALSFQRVHDMLRRRSALCHEQCKAVILLQLFRNDLHQELLCGIPDHLAVPGILLSRVDPRDQEDLPAALSAHQIRKLHVL